MTENEPLVSLKDYLIKNRDPLTILGVFLAIAAFSSGLSIKLVAIFISISAITCAAFIAIEVWREPLGGKPSLILSFFRASLFILTLSLTVYCFYFFDAIYPDILFPIVIFILVGIEVWLIRKLKEKFGWMRKVAEWYKRTIFRKYVIATVIVISTMVLGRFIANKIDLPVFQAVVWIATVSNNIKGSIQ